VFYMRKYTLSLQRSSSWNYSSVLNLFTAMINYSIVMRSVNANLIEINAAKGRIKAARAKGETPNADDVALVKTEKQHAFAVAQYTDVMTIEKFARHIATHGCVYSRADISAILYLAVDCMREMLLEGRKVRLGDLGDFSVSLSSKGAESAEKFSAANITAVNVEWDCGPEFKNLLVDAEFNLVASRSAQAALLKAIKSGSPVVDLGASSGSETDPDAPSSGSGSGTGTDGGSSDAGSGEDSGEVEQVFIGTSVNDQAMGSVTGTGTYAKGSVVTLTATPNEGYRFVSWGDDVTDNPRTVTADVNGVVYSAVFEAEA